VLVDTLADAQHVAVGMLDVHFADVPRRVLGWADDVQAMALAGGVDLVDVVDPDLPPRTSARLWHVCGVSSAPPQRTFSSSSGSSAARSCAANAVFQSAATAAAGSANEGMEDDVTDKA